MSGSKRVAEVQYSTSIGSRPIVEMSVPQGTHMSEIAKSIDTLSKELFPKIGPRGCAPCISGIDFNIRERLNEVVRIDLETGGLIR